MPKMQRRPGIHENLELARAMFDELPSALRETRKAWLNAAVGSNATVSMVIDELDRIGTAIDNLEAIISRLPTIDD